MFGFPSFPLSPIGILSEREIISLCSGWMRKEVNSNGAKEAGAACKIG